MSLTGTTIYLHELKTPLHKRLQSRKFCGPCQWTVPKPGYGKGRGYYAKDDVGTPGASSFVLRAIERPRRHDHGWYVDDFRDDAIYPVVLRLPHSRGYLAGWTMGKNMASSVDFDIFDDISDAWAAADSMAEHAAEAEQDYRAAEDERMRLEDEREAELENFAACHPPIESPEACAAISHA